MKVRVKLTLLVAGSISALVVAACAYLIILAPVRGIEKERSYVTAVGAKTKEFQALLVSLMTDSIGSSIKVFDNTAKAYRASFDAMDNIKLLVKASSQGGKIVDTAKSLRALIEPDLNGIAELLPLLSESAKLLYIGAGAIAPFRFFDAPSKAGASPEDLAIARNRLNTFIATVQKLNGDLAVAAGAFSKQDQAIDATIASISARSFTIAAIIVAVLVAITLGLSLRAAASLAGSILSLGRVMAATGAGDLASRVSLRSRDEVGVLATDFNSLLDILDTSFSEIKKASAENRSLGEELKSSVNESTSSAIEIEANAASIRSQMERMDGLVETSRSSVDAMGRGILGFNRRLEGQDAMVEGSVSAVTQMMASIGNIARIAGGDREAAESLVAEAERGRAVFESAFGKITEIEGSIGAIQEMASVIAGIASRTNLLAMNAAIEAAHAGDYGRGFAVVADEIRKLSEASARSSTKISADIRGVTEKIREAALTRSATSAAFDAINARIRSVSGSVAEIYSNVAEVQAGSKQILDSMSELRGQSSEVTEESRGIASGAEAIRSTMESLARISHEVVANIGEIASGLADISSSIRDVSGRAARIGGIGDEMEGLASRFATRSSQAPSEPEGAESGVGESEG